MATHSERAKARIHRRRAKLRAIKEESGCRACGLTDPDRLHFHHREPHLKEFTICAPGGLRKAWPKVQAEISKCDILCKECHDREHAEMRAASFDPEEFEAGDDGPAF